MAMAQPTGNWINAERSSAGGGNILVNLDHVRAIENAPDGLAILYFAGDKSVAISESMDEFFMRAQGRK